MHIKPSGHQWKPTWSHLLEHELIYVNGGKVFYTQWASSHRRISIVLNPVFYCLLQNCICSCLCSNGLRIFLIVFVRVVFPCCFAIWFGQRSWSRKRQYTDATETTWVVCQVPPYLSGHSITPASQRRRFDSCRGGAWVDYMTVPVLNFENMCNSNRE